MVRFTKNLYIMSAETFLKGLNYETFIRKAFSKNNTPYPQNLSKGADESVFQNLVRLEQGDEIKTLGNFNKHITKVKGYINKALTKLGKKGASKDLIEVLLMDLEKAKTSDEVYIIIEKGLKL